MSCQTCGRSRNDVGQSLYTFGRIFAAVERRSHAILYFSRVFNHFTWLESGIVSQDGQRFHCWRNRTTFDAFIEPGGGNIQWYNPGTCRKWHASSLSSWKGLQTWALTMVGGRCRWRRNFQSDRWAPQMDIQIQFLIKGLHLAPARFPFATICLAPWMSWKTKPL